MKVLKYKQGQERCPLIETSEYEDSIFMNQYAQALTLINGFLSPGNKEDSSLKCVAFCGDRGEGKTSCMSSVLDIIKHYSDERSAACGFLKTLKLDHIIKSKATTIEIIDPSFFDEAHNVLEIIIGQLYNSSKSVRKTDRIALRNDLYSIFNEVKTSLNNIKNKDYESLNNLHELSILAASIRLQEQMTSLIDTYLRFVEADYLVVAIDDIDLDIKYAYRMCEQIRKYLCLPQCIVLMAFKMQQLQNVVAQAMKDSIGGPDERNSLFPTDTIIEMAKKYISKLIPVTSRVEMPKADSLGDICIVTDNAVAKVKFDSLKESIVELIFNRTRYLFYNPFDGVSPIVFGSLRDTVNLLGLLSSMEEIPDSRDSSKQEAFLNNKNLFKYFFFNVWKNRFPDFIQSELDSLINFDFGTSFNREVIDLLDEHFDDYLQKDYSNQSNIEKTGSSDPNDSDGYMEMRYRALSGRRESFPIVTNTVTHTMLNSITEKGNFGYNITIGDVFYVFSFLESETLSETDFALVFFLKSLYSIKLYEAYDFITEDVTRVYPKEKKDRAGLSIIDHRFDNTNKLQQLIGGSYFTYCPGDLLPRITGVYDLDLRIIGSTPLNALLSDLRKEYPEIMEIIKVLNAGHSDKKDIDKASRFFDKLNVAEFFILTIQCAIPQKLIDSSNPKMEVVRALQRLRRNVNPFHYAPFFQKTGYYLFDITAPFSNLVNAEYAYRRFETIDEDFFRFIMQSDKSLLNKIISVCSKGRAYINHQEDGEWTRIHRLLSDCIIRNAEVLTSIKNNMVIRRNKSHESGWDNFWNFYGSLNNSGMKTHRTSSSTAPDEIAFNFLEPIDCLFKAIKEPAGEAETNMRDLFFSIFDYRTIKQDDATSEEKKSEKDNEKLSLADLLATVRNYKKPTSIRECMKKLQYFSNYSDAMLIDVLPDKPDDSNYTPEEVKEVLTKWFRKQFRKA